MTITPEGISLSKIKQKLCRCSRKAFAGRGAAVLNKKGIKMTETVEKTENEKNLLTVFVAGFKNMFNFKTRASKYDYWGFIFANFLFSLILLVVGIIMSMLFPMKTMMIIGTVLYYVYSIVEAIAALALSVRRLHDTNHSGQLLWLPVILGVCMLLGVALEKNTQAEVIGMALMTASGVAFLGVIVWLLILYLRKGQAEENGFGKPVAENAKYNKLANIYIISYFAISIALSAISVALDNDSNQQDEVDIQTNAADAISGETSAVTVDANADTNADIQEPVKTETEAQPENSTEVETPAVPMHGSAE